MASSISQFFYDTRSELRKVVWPSREQAINLTALVIGVSIAVAAFVGVVDVLLQKFFQILAGG
jgi:preprotein translocase subunit SecE